MDSKSTFLNTNPNGHKKVMLILSENIDFSTGFIHLSTVINRFIHKIFHSYPQIG